MKKTVLLMSMILTFSCSHMGDKKEMTGPSGEKVHKASCQTREMEECFNEAKRTCKNRYQIVSHDDMNHHKDAQSNRHLYFYCN